MWNLDLAPGLRPRDRLREERTKTARVGLAALVLHAMTIVALVALARGKLWWLAGFGVAAVELVIARAVGVFAGRDLGSRRRSEI
jgi:hypothetical protein